MIAIALALVAQLSAGQVDSSPGARWMRRAFDGKDIYATLKTSMGDVQVKLYAKQSPKTVANFVGLAAGEKEWTEPGTGQKTQKPLYDGTRFHRIISGFMVQGGDPAGDGTGQPGFTFEDEHNGLRFDKPGLLAMANRGPNTNGSQFFITVSTPHYLDGHYNIFGEVIGGYDVVERISRVPTQRDRPTTEVKLLQVVLSEKTPKAKKK